MLSLPKVIIAAWLLLSPSHADTCTWHSTAHDIDKPQSNPSIDRWSSIRPLVRVSIFSLLYLCIYLLSLFVHSSANWSTKCACSTELFPILTSHQYCQQSENAIQLYFFNQQLWIAYSLIIASQSVSTPASIIHCTNHLKQNNLYGQTTDDGFSK